MKAVIRAVEYYLPERVLGNDELAKDYPEWTPERIEQKLGIVERHIAAPDECASDMGVKAAQKLFASGACAAADIDFILFCTQSPDYYLPTSACVMQDRLGVPISAGALDFNLGCSGYVYGLSLAQGLIETGQAKNVLLITADTYSKFLHPQDKGVRTLFGDAAAATLVSGVDQADAGIGPFVFGTDGRGAHNLIVEAGGTRKPVASGEVIFDEQGNPKSEACLFMNGPEIFSFTQEMVPKLIEAMLAKAGLAMEQIDLFVFHQANKYMLDFLRKKIGIAREKFYVSMKHAGNTVSSTIPIGLHHALADGSLKPGGLAMLVGFGVGYSWGATLVRLGTANSA
ncbi:MAG: ketoacyl-ACP synthase III [Verrucomicrobiaceae bacterium]